MSARQDARQHPAAVAALDRRAGCTGKTSTAARFLLEHGSRCTRPRVDVSLEEIQRIQFWIGADARAPVWMYRPPPAPIAVLEQYYYFRQCTQEEQETRKSLQKSIIHGTN